MTLSKHGAGLNLDAHEGDPAAHPGLTAGLIPAATISGAGMLVPAGSVVAASAAAAWYTANAATFMRFHNPYRRGFRYINLHVGTASGNIQVGVVGSIRRAAGVDYATRIMSSGVIACPSGAARIDCGETVIPAGDLALFLWCDNITAQFLHGTGTGLLSSRMLFTNTVAGGVPASEIVLTGDTRWVTALTLEADIG